MNEVSCRARIRAGPVYRLAEVRAVYPRLRGRIPSGIGMHAMGPRTCDGGGVNRRQFGGGEGVRDLKLRGELDLWMGLSGKLSGSDERGEEGSELNSAAMVAIEISEIVSVNSLRGSDEGVPRSCRCRKVLFGTPDQQE